MKQHKESNDGLEKGAKVLLEKEKIEGEELKAILGEVTRLKSDVGKQHKREDFLPWL